LDVAVGSGALEMTKCLLEFHCAKATRETLKMALSIGSFELIKLIRERLPEAELRDRVDLLEAASEFHQPEVFEWLVRDVTTFEVELLVVFAIERKLADSLAVANEAGLHLWWNPARETALLWRASSQLKFVPAPEGFTPEGGWWTAVSGVTSALPAFGPRSVVRGMPSKSATKNSESVSVSGEKWTTAMSEAFLGGKATVKSVVFSTGVIGIDHRALMEFGVLESVAFPVGCAGFGSFAFASCASLRALTLPVGCKMTGIASFVECTALTSVVVPDGCTRIGNAAFQCCTSLTSVKIPSSCEAIDPDAFAFCALREVMIPDGCEIGSAAFEKCIFLTTVTIGAGCTTVARYAFVGCAALSSVVLPSTLKLIDCWAFGDCPALVTIAIPNGCYVSEDAFDGSKTRVTEL
jgi:hypothetical protein